MTEFGSDWRFAYGKVRGTDGATNVAPYFLVGNVQSITRTGAGVYDLVLTEGLPQVNCGKLIRLVNGGNSGQVSNITWVNPLLIRVNIFINNVATDTDFIFELLRV